MKNIRDINLNPGMRILLRADLNVPMANNRITDDTRIQAALPGIKLILDSGASLLILSHLGRPDKKKTPQEQPQFSLKPVAEYLGTLLGQEVEVCLDIASASVRSAQTPACRMLENTRFLVGETENNEQLSKELGALCDVFVMDAFGSAHRAHASTEGVTRFAPISCAGLLVEQETNALDRIMQNAARPFVVILGGAKVGDKLAILQPLAQRADTLIVGGGIANTFLAASGYPVGASLYEKTLLEEAQKIMNMTQVPLPEDLIVADSLESAQGEIKLREQIMPTDMILDIGPKTQELYMQIVEQAGSILWNGPVGVFEKEAFAQGTRTLTHAVTESAGFSLAGGGDTIAAINLFDGQPDYISTGGGAFLEYIEKDGRLPALITL